MDVCKCHRRRDCHMLSTAACGVGQIWITIMSCRQWTTVNMHLAWRRRMSVSIRTITSEWRHLVSTQNQLFICLYPPAGQIGKWRHNIISLFSMSVLTFVRLLPDLWTWYFENKWTYFDATWHKWSGPHGKGMKRLGQEVKDQDHTKPKVDLEAWWWHHS